jgi:hypothetical protein
LFCTELCIEDSVQIPRKNLSGFYYKTFQKVGLRM